MSLPHLFSGGLYDNGLFTLNGGRLMPFVQPGAELMLLNLDTLQIVDTQIAEGTYLLKITEDQFLYEGANENGDSLTRVIGSDGKILSEAVTGNFFSYSCRGTNCFVTKDGRLVTGIRGTWGAKTKTWDNTSTLLNGITVPDVEFANAGFGTLVSGPDGLYLANLDNNFKSKSLGAAFRYSCKTNAVAAGNIIRLSRPFIPSPDNSVTFALDSSGPFAVVHADSNGNATCYTDFNDNWFDFAYSLDLKNGQRITLGHDGDVKYFSTDGSLIRSVPTPMMPGTTPDSSTRRYDTTVLSSDGKFMIGCRSDFISLFDTSTGNIVAFLKAKASEQLNFCTFFDVSPSGNIVVLDNDSLQVWHQQ